MLDVALQEQAVRVSSQLDPTREFGLGLIIAALVILVTISLIDLANPEKGPRR